MSNPIPVNLAVEDPLSEAVLRKLLEECGGPWAIGTVFNRGGVGYLRRMIPGFNNAARGVPFVVLADLDRAACVPDILPTWLPHGPQPNLILRFAVREVEAWLLADSSSLRRFLGIKSTVASGSVEELVDPKRDLVRLAADSGKSEIVADVVPKKGSTATVGRNYNARLIRYVQSDWDPHVARESSDSLSRAMDALDGFEPSWAAASGD